MFLQRCSFQKYNTLLRITNFDTFLRIRAVWSSIIMGMNQPTFGLGTKSCTWTILLAKSALNCNLALRVQIPLRDIIPFLDPTLFHLKSTLVLACLLFCKTNTIFLTSIIHTIIPAKQSWIWIFWSSNKKVSFTIDFDRKGIAVQIERNKTF